jgi:NAD(P)-dependent dehydrogenase (short-subunit alcohol dehydrogenase family)
VEEKSMAQLDGKVAIITGAGGMKGIGRACALKLAGLGADIVVSDFRREEKDLPPQESKAGLAQHRQRRRGGGEAGPAAALRIGAISPSRARSRP